MCAGGELNKGNGEPSPCGCPGSNVRALVLLKRKSRTGDMPTLRNTREIKKKELDQYMIQPELHSTWSEEVSP